VARKAATGMSGQDSTPLTRRAVLRGVAGSALASVLAACGGPDVPPSTPLPNAAFRGTEAASNAGFAAATAVGTPISATPPVDLVGQLKESGLRFALLPGQNPMQEIADNGEILAFLRASLGKPIAGKVSAEYATVVNALNAKTVDIAYFSPLAYIWAKPKASLTPMIQGESPDGKFATNRTFVIVPGGSPVQTNPMELRGKTVAFTDQNSLSGYLVPAYSLAKNLGMKPNADYRPDFRGTAAAVYAAVMSGQAAAGAIPYNDFEDGVAKGQINKDALHVLDTSFDYPGSIIAARISLDPGDFDLIQRAFLALSNQPQQAKVLTQFVLGPPRGTGSFGGNTVKVRIADDSIYDTLRDIPPTLGIALEQIVR